MSIGLLVKIWICWIVAPKTWWKVSPGRM